MTPSVLKGVVTVDESDDDVIAMFCLSHYALCTASVLAIAVIFTVVHRSTSTIVYRARSLSHFAIIGSNRREIASGYGETRKRSSSIDYKHHYWLNLWFVVVTNH